MRQLPVRRLTYFLGPFLVSILLVTSCSIISSGNNVNTPTPGRSPTITPTSSLLHLHYTPYQALMAQVYDLGPVYVTADGIVPAQALRIASMTLATMLRHRPDVISVLQSYGTITVIIGRDQNICDIPYFTIYKGSDVCMSNEGGTDGMLGLPVTACNERNILKESDDPYGRGTLPDGQNFCVHELAHTIMDIGLSQADSDRIEARYEAAKTASLWSGDYAMTNDLEFFAEMSQAYFWSDSAVPDSNNHYGINGPDALKQYDPQTFALIDSIYRGSSNLE